MLGACRPDAWCRPSIRAIFASGSVRARPNRLFESFLPFRLRSSRTEVSRSSASRRRSPWPFASASGDRSSPLSRRTIVRQGSVVLPSSRPSTPIRSPFTKPRSATRDRTQPKTFSWTSLRSGASVSSTAQRMIGNLVAARQAQELAKRQRIRTTPTDCRARCRYPRNSRPVALVEAPARQHTMPAMAAGGADEAVRPAQPGQCRAALLLGAEGFAKRLVAQPAHPRCNLEPHIRDLPRQERTKNICLPKRSVMDKQERI